MLTFIFSSVLGEARSLLPHQLTQLSINNSFNEIVWCPLLVGISHVKDAAFMCIQVHIVEHKFDVDLDCDVLHTEDFSHHLSKLVKPEWKNVKYRDKDLREKHHEIFYREVEESIKTQGLRAGLKRRLTSWISVLFQGHCVPLSDKPDIMTAVKISTFCLRAKSSSVSPHMSQKASWSTIILHSESF